MRKEYDKLVRDKIPEIIRKNNAEPFIHVADEKEYRSKLLAKVVEEAEELIEAGNDKERVEELADVLEVIQSIATEFGFSMEHIEKLRLEKAKKRGGFKDRIILDSVEEKEAISL